LTRQHSHALIAPHRGCKTVGFIKDAEPETAGRRQYFL